MLQVKRFNHDDFESLCATFDRQWGWELGDDFELRHDLAVHYLAAALAGADIVRVASVDGQTVGVMCAQVADLPSSHDDGVPDKSRYLSLCALSGQRLQASELGRKALSFYATIDAANAQLEQEMSQSSKYWDAEMTLLLCDAAARGKGVGKALVASLFVALQKCSAHYCMLKTDSHCNWQFYEKQQWELAASVPWPDKSGIIGFAFRKPVLETV